MNQKSYRLILILISACLIAVIATQFYWLKLQYAHQQEELILDSKEAIAETDTYLRNQINSQASIDSDEIENIDLYYESADSALEVIFQGVTRRMNEDGTMHQMNEVVLDKRLRQFQTIVENLDETRPYTDTTLGENFLILYGQKDLTKISEKDWNQLNDHFAIDSFLSDALHRKGISIPFIFGIYDNAEKGWKFHSTQQDSLLEEQMISEVFYDETLMLHLQFKRSATHLMQAITIPIVLSTLLTLIILSSLLFMYHIIMKQKKLSEIQNDFINNMTHEFKTPLATIAFATANIENPTFIKDEEKVRQFTRVISAENKRMNRQVEQVLGAALSDRQGFRLAKKPINIDSIIEDLIRSYSLKFAKDQFKIVTDLNTAGKTIQGDSLHISNTLSNLLDNAHKYSPNGGTITIETRVKVSELVIKISDQGMGMSQETQHKIFDKFYRVPTGNLHNIKGFGLGLSYAKAIVEQHQGTIEVDSKLGKGSTFVIKLPIAHNGS